MTPAQTDDLETRQSLYLENLQLKGEAGVMRSLLQACLGVMSTIDADDEFENQQLIELTDKVKLAIRGAP